MTTDGNVGNFDANEPFNVIIVGAGAAGIGAAIAVQHTGLGNYIVVDRDTVGSSFASWPAETRFITPSFPSNSIGMLDLNSIGIGISPAFNMRIEHPTGQEFASHLQSLVDFLELPIRENTNIESIEKHDDLFHLKTATETLISKNVIYTNLKNILKGDVIEIDIRTKDALIFMYEENKKINIKSKN